MGITAVKSFGGDEKTREFSETSWASGAPEKNGWRKVDMNVEVIAKKLPEHAEIAAKKVTEVVIPPMPLVEEPEADDAIPADEVAAPEVAPLPPTDEEKTEKAVKTQKAKPGKKKAA